MIFIFWSCIFFILYTYFLYPLILFLLRPTLRVRNPPEPHDWPNVSIIICAHNEETVIQRRIENCLDLDYPKGSLEILIASDGSNDKTVTIAKQFCDRGVTVHDYLSRRGKVNVLNETIPKTKHEIIVFSDANTIFEPDAVKKLVRHFVDKRIGCVCGELRFVNAKGSRTGDLEGVYWKFETWLKEQEGARGSLLGANGGIFAIRKELFTPPPADTIVEDFVMAMKILEKGSLVIYEREARAVEEAARNVVLEKKRRVRIGSGDFQALFMLMPMLNPARGFSALAFLSHKVVRWFVPFFMIGALITNLFLWDEPLYRITMVLQILFYTAAVIGQTLIWSGVGLRLFNLCYYFVSMNLALLLGFFRFLFKTQKVTWERTER